MLILQLVLAVVGLSAVSTASTNHVYESKHELTPIDNDDINVNSRVLEDAKSIGLRRLEDGDEEVPLLIASQINIGRTTNEATKQEQIDKLRNASGAAGSHKGYTQYQRAMTRDVNYTMSDTLPEECTASTSLQSDAILVIKKWGDVSGVVFENLEEFNRKFGFAMGYTDTLNVIMLKTVGNEYKGQEAKAAKKYVIDFFKKIRENAIKYAAKVRSCIKQGICNSNSLSDANAEFSRGNQTALTEFSDALDKLACPTRP